MYCRCPSAYNVSNANDDLPLPETPVMTVICPSGMSRSTFCRLCTRTPRKRIEAGFDVLGFRKSSYRQSWFNLPAARFTICCPPRNQPRNPPRPV